MRKSQKIILCAALALGLAALAAGTGGKPILGAILVFITAFVGAYGLLNYAERHSLKTPPPKPKTAPHPTLDTLYERENYRREFVGNVAHELKTPLFSIQGYLLTLIEGGVDDESIRDKYLHRINKSVERLTYIVKDLDLITELESGNLKLDIYPFNIVALVQEVFELLEIKAENNHIKLEFDKDYEEPIKVSGDIEKIEQVLMNLIVNAINHSQRASTVQVAFQVMKDSVQINISDTGMGIKPEEMQRIFERFYRADKSRSRQQGGSGLGLAIVKHILEAHQQKISVQSTYGEGSVFSFSLKKA
uniref:sensor histidine kinase n=1 Tax=Ornithobacterium rhinotracheale TaxID=28251 RepID=UPI0021AA760A|nr:ATP-binding protein [Ornithobacterium rhinotracheale]